MDQDRLIVPTPAASTYAASDGAAYEIFLGRWTRRLAEAFLDFVAVDVPATGDLLDAGCGTGSLAAAMATRFPQRRVVGIDIAEPYVRHARAQAPGPVFAVADVARLPCADATFATAMAQLVLNFVPAAGVALSELRRVTHRGGVVAAAGWDFRGGLVYQRLFWDTAAGIDPGAGAARDRLFSGSLALPNGLANLFAQGGLAHVERASITIRMDYGDFADYWCPLLGGQGPVGTYVTGLSTDLRSRIEEAVRRAYCAGAPDGPRSMTATAWAVRGVVP